MNAVKWQKGLSYRGLRNLFRNFVQALFPTKMNLEVETSRP
jgi:hypothetical protein